LLRARDLADDLDVDELRGGIERSIAHLDELRAAPVTR
jgi:hypothetical protein